MIKAVQVKPKAPPFGVLSTLVERRINNSDRVSSLDAASYRYASGMRELEQQFEAKASELRQAYLDEVGVVYGEIAEAS